MLIEKFEIFLTLFAGLILLVLGLVYNFALSDVLLRLLIVMAAFYVIGLIVKTYLRKRIFFEIETEQTHEDNETEATETETEPIAENTNTEADTENQPAL